MSGKAIGTIRLNGLTRDMRVWYRRLRREGKLTRWQANAVVMGAMLWAESGLPSAGIVEWHEGVFTGAPLP